MQPENLEFQYGLKRLERHLGIVPVRSLTVHDEICCYPQNLEHLSLIPNAYPYGRFDRDDKILRVLPFDRDGMVICCDFLSVDAYDEPFYRPHHHSGDNCVMYDLGLDLRKSHLDDVENCYRIHLHISLGTVVDHDLRIVHGIDVSRLSKLDMENEISIGMSKHNL